MVAANLRNTDEETMVTLNELLQRGRTHEREEGRAQGFWEGFREGELEKRAECVSHLWDEETGQAFEALLSQTDATSWPSLLDLYSAHQRGHNPLQLLDASANPQVREEDLHEGRVETQLAKYAEYVSLCWGKETGQAFKALLSQTDVTSWPSLRDLYSAYRQGHNPLQLLGASANPRDANEETRIPLNELRQRDRAQGFREGQLAERAECVSLLWNKEIGQAFKALMSQAEAASWPSLRDLHSARHTGQSPLQLLGASDKGRGQSAQRR